MVSDLTISELVMLNRLRLLCPQGYWKADGRTWRGWRYRPSLISWSRRLRDRHEAGESWAQLKQWTKQRTARKVSG